jgi:hypothetical protein
MSQRPFTLATIAEGISRTAVNAGNSKIVEKWAGLGLLEGLQGVQRERMARMLENQAIEVLKGTSSFLNETNALSLGGAGLQSSGQIAGFTNVAFPIVRRVFAGLIANEIVSVQPMSLPSGLLFYLDYTYGSNVGGDAGTSANQFSTTSTTTNEVFTKGQSVYNGPAGAGVRSGSLAAGGQYGLIGTDYTKVQKQALNLTVATNSVGFWLSGSTWTTGSTASVRTSADFVGYNARFVGFDPQVEIDLANNVLDYCFVFMSASEITSNINGADLASMTSIALTGFGSSPGGVTAWGEKYQGGQGVLNLRGATKRGNWNYTTGIFEQNALGGSHLMFVVALSNTGAPPTVGNATTNAVTASAVLGDSLSVNSDGSAVTVPQWETDWAVDASPRIPEVDIKIESVAVTATTRKLRARWSPEMAQDLTAFYSIDVEQELTNILSEMVTLDIDREILNDLLTQASAANYFWSRAPGRFVNKYTGQEGTRSSTVAPGPNFAGTVKEWYETLVETVTDVANVIHKKTLRGSGNFIVCGPEVATILEHTTAYRASVKFDNDGQVKDNMVIGAEPIGNINGRYSVLKDPYFPVNKILVGLKGSTFLESGFIYAPYVPLILTPVIYAQEDFTPRKGIMTRYGKKMVRADFYGTVTILDMGLI